MSNNKNQDNEQLPENKRTSMYEQEVKIKDRYKKQRSLHLTNKPITGGFLRVGRIDVELKGQVVNSACKYGHLHPNGVLTKMGPLYEQFGLEDGDEVKMECVSESSIRLDLGSDIRKSNISAECNAKPVLEKKGCRQRHHEPFRIQNWARWNPTQEKDVYFAFGELRRFTDYTYCSSMTKEIARGLNYSWSPETDIPDSLLIEDATETQVVAEFKMRSSLFKANHNKEDVDVLVVWEDDDPYREDLPNKIVCLKEVAKNAAAEEIYNHDLQKG